jgi:peptidyl-prolyl cis-trans isomerase C
MTTVLDTSRGAPSAASAPRPELTRSKPVSVNGVVIPRGEIARETQHHPATKPIEAWQAAARALAVRELLLQEAKRLGIAPKPQTDAEGRRETDEEAIVRQLVEQEVVTPDPDEETCRRVYEQRRQAFRSSDLYGVRHILLAAPSADATARAEARRQAETIIAMVKADPACFSSLAAAHSACPSKAQGGALGQISRGQTVPEFEAGLADAPVGAVAGMPIETRYGVHVVFVDHKCEGQALPFELVRETISDWLIERSENAAIKQYISFLAGRATITGIDLEASPSPLVR